MIYLKFPTIENLLHSLCVQQFCRFEIQDWCLESSLTYLKWFCIFLSTDYRRWIKTTWRNKHNNQQLETRLNINLSSQQIISKYEYLPKSNQLQLRAALQINSSFVDSVRCVICGRQLRTPRSRRLCWRVCQKNEFTFCIFCPVSIISNV